MGRLLAYLRDIHWKMLLVHDMEIWEVLMKEVQMEKFLASLRGESLGEESGI